MDQPPEIYREPDSPEDVPPRHGFQGDRGFSPAPRSWPQALSITVSREAGARGGTIARRVGRKLGWQVYDQEMLDYMVQDSVVAQGVLDNLPAAALAWSQSQVEQLRLRPEGSHPLVMKLARVVLALAAQGEVVLIGRGAGCILPRETTLNVRVVAPLPERIAYMSQWLRLTLQEAEERLRLRDEGRGEFVANHFHRQVADVHQYDLVLNSSLLGEEVCVDLIIKAAKAKAGQPEEGAGHAHT
jgi:cytidylate kinase